MTGNSYIDSGIHYFNLFILGFAVLVMFSYLVLALISAFSLRRHLRENSFINYDAVLRSELAPHLSIIAPAYNEGSTIEENVKSLLGLNYNHYEVVIVNDGSRDSSMEILRKAYKLEKQSVEYHQAIPTKEVRGIYKSSNPAYSRLTVIDKENGGKADALNTGINYSRNPYVVCIDVDCIMDKDALLKLVKPLLEHSDSQVVATGGVVRIANSCVIKSGKLVEARVPSALLPRIQAIEYLRAFILGRMAWSRLDGLLIISGAFGMFDRRIVLESGGYNTHTVGEDMELVVRIRRKMIEARKKYTVAYIPDPLCWTEAPENFQILRRQRSRWTRGTMETLWIHRRMLLNPKYRQLGMISVPYWMLFEYLAPIVEFVGLMISVLFVCLGILNWSFFSLLLLFVYLFAVLFSTLALFAEEFTYQQYRSVRDFRKFFFVALLEPLYFHPFTVYSALKGNWEKLRRKKSWGEMTRKGFGTNNK